VNAPIHDGTASDYGAPEEFPHSRYWLVLILWAFALSGGWLLWVCGGAK